MTTSIIPLVEQYGEHSKSVWEASKFWKQFFEASANVSLSGYEELANDDESNAADESTAMRDDTEVDYSRQERDATATPGREQSTFQAEDSLLDEHELTGSTPRPPAKKPRLSSLESPYEAMKREMQAEEEEDTTVLRDIDDDEDDTSVMFAQKTARLPDMSMTPAQLRDMGQESTGQKSKDPLLHRILDKNYRLQATPHKPTLRISPLKGKEKEKEKTPGKLSWQDSPMSSPELEMPKLRSAVFASPGLKSTSRQKLAAATKGPRTPGVSVQTPGTARKTKDVFADEDTGEQGDDGRYEIDWTLNAEEDDDLDLYGGMSPPKTIQFAVPPSKLLQTPGKLIYAFRKSSILTVI